VIEFWYSTTKTVVIGGGHSEQHRARSVLRPVRSPCVVLVELLGDGGDDVGDLAALALVELMN
jgi:hypothetical protein